MFDRVCLASYHEIGLKGRNRSVFERRLQDNLDAALGGLAVSRTRRVSSRLAVEVLDAELAGEVALRMSRIPGVNNVASGLRCPHDLESIEQAVIEVASESGPFSSFAIESKRSNTDFEMGSQALNRHIGAFVQRRTGARVDLGRPDLLVRVAVIHRDAYVSTSRLKGAGGLPVGTASPVISLLSSGIDSPVATWRIMRRGAVALGLHFSGRPQVSAESERIVARIGSVLERTGGLGRIYVVPFGDLQKEISLAVPPDLRVIIYRRLMMRIAERVAAVERAKAIVTGESLGQVASQTLENIAAVDEAATLPVLRPLIGSDKLEIMEEARRIETFELSIEDASDCCTLFMPRNPETHAKMRAVLDAWGSVDHERMADDALGSLEWLDFRCPAYRPPKRWPTPAGQPGSSAAAMRL